MSRTQLPLRSADISEFARTLRNQIANVEKSPSHLELLNMLARSAGFRNFQHLRAQSEACAKLEAPEPSPAVDYSEVKSLLRFFDAKGRLVQWPAKASQRMLCLWVIWVRIPPRKPLTEEQLNRLLKSEHLFSDPALLRRELFDRRMVNRTPDCREYRRIEQRPPDQALALICALDARRRS